MYVCIDIFVSLSINSNTYYMKRRKFIPDILETKNISTFLLFVILGAGVIHAQHMHVGSSGVVSVSAGNALYVNNNLTVAGAGSLSVKSDSSTSGSLLVSGTATGDITYERNILNTDWYLVSSPVSTQNIDNFAKSNNYIGTYLDNYAIAAYNNILTPGQKWEYYNTTTAPNAGNFISARGYSMNRSESGHYTFEGAMANSAVSYVVSTSAGSHYWECIGNPFPSFVLGADGESASLLKNNMDILSEKYVALYLWDGNEYKTINLLSAPTYFAPGQAFMVKANSASETFNFSKNLLSHQNGDNAFYRSMIPTIELYLSSGDKKISTTLKYTENGSLGLDPGYDAGAYQDGTPAFSINTHLVENSQGLDMTLQCLPNSNFEDQIIPVSVNAAAGSNLHFNVDHSDFPEELHIYLEDVFTNEIVDLKEEDYQVNIQNDLQGIGRFYLYTSQEELSIAPEVLSDIGIYSPDNQELIITGLQGNNLVDLNIYNAVGQIVHSYQFKAEQKISLTLPPVPAGVYITELQTDREKHSKKLVISKL